MPPEESLGSRPLYGLERGLTQAIATLAARADAAFGGRASVVAGGVALLTLPILAGLTAGITIAYFLVQPVLEEQAWYLYAAGRLLDGASLYGAEVMETNPPLIIWMTVAPVALARLIGLAPMIAFNLCAAVLIVAVICWSLRLARRSIGISSWQWLGGFGITLAYVTAIYPWTETGSQLPFGQREHVTVLLILPYLIMAAGRIRGRALVNWEAAAAGLAAGVGLCLKPHQLLIVLAVEALLLIRTRAPRNLWRRETVGIALAGVLYGVAIWLFARDYVTRVLPLLFDVYGEVGNASLAQLIGLSRFGKMSALIVLYVLLCRWLRAEALVSVIVAAACGASAAFVLQRKGWDYQFLPAQMFFRTALGLMAVDLFSRWSEAIPAPRRGGRLAIVVVVAVSGLMAIAVAYPLRSSAAAATWKRGRVAEFTASFFRLPAGTPVYVMSATLAGVFSPVMDRGLLWASRFPHLWTLPAVLQNDPAAGGKRTHLSAARVESLGRELRAEMAADFGRWHPAVVLVERCTDAASPCYSMEGLSVDLPQWFARDPAFAALWSDYRLSGTLEDYDVYVLKSATNS